MPLLRAQKTVYTTPRVYADETTLIDPRSGRTWTTLQPRLASAAERVANALGTQPDNADASPDVEQSRALHLPAAITSAAP